MAVIEIVGIEVDAAGGDPGLVDAEDLPDILRVIAEAIIHAVAQAGGHLDSRLAHDGAAVFLEAHRVITGVAAAQQAVGDHDADGQAGAHVVEVAVDAGHHPVALCLQFPGGGGDGGALCQDAAEGDNGGHIPVGGVGDEVLLAEVRIGSAPEHIGGELRLLVQDDLLTGQVLPQGLRRGGGQGQGAQQGQRQQQGQGLAETVFHGYPPSVRSGWYT